MINCVSFNSRTVNATITCMHAAQETLTHPGPHNSHSLQFLKTIWHHKDIFAGDDRIVVDAELYLAYD